MVGRVPSDTVLKSMNTVHRLLLKITGGRFGSTSRGVPVLELTTTGRAQRPSPARCCSPAPLREGDA